MLKVDHLSHVYSEGTPFACKALDDVSFTVRQGDFIGLIGHTGSGKSTLIQHLNGLLTPTSGTVYYKDHNIFNGNKKDLIKIRQHVGLIFQYPEYQLFEDTVEKDVAFGPKNMGLDRDEIDLRVQNALEMVGLNTEAIRLMSPFDLSGGQMRRVAIAGVLAMSPDILILDEPAAGLDPAGRDEILSEIKKMHDEKNITVILVSHSMEDVAKMANRLIVMHEGGILFDDAPAQVFRHVKELEEIGLGVPESVKLMFKLKKTYPDIRTDILTIEDAAEEIIRVRSMDQNGGKGVR